MNGKGSRRRTGADDEAFKRAPWPPPSPVFRKATHDNSCILQDLSHIASVNKVDGVDHDEREEDGRT